MTEPSYDDLAPAWVWLATAGSGVLAVAVFAVFGTAYGTALNVLAGATAVGVVYLLYRWGQVREKEPSEKSDREKEMEAEAGGYGGSGGGG